MVVNSFTYKKAKIVSRSAFTLREEKKKEEDKEEREELLENRPVPSHLEVESNARTENLQP